MDAKFEKVNAEYQKCPPDAPRSEDWQAWQAPAEVDWQAWQAQQAQQWGNTATASDWTTGGEWNAENQGDDWSKAAEWSAENQGIR